MAGYRSLNESTVSGVACTSRVPLLYHQAIVARLKTCARCPRTALPRMPEVPCNLRIPSMRFPSGVSTVR